MRGLFVFAAVITFLCTALVSFCAGYAGAFYMDFVTSLQGEPTGVTCGDPCVIESSPGGYLKMFELQGAEFVFEKKKIIVDGPCISACTRLVDIDRANVCLTTNAVFGVHQWTDTGDDGKDTHGVVKYDTPGLNEYIAAHGGEPIGEPLLIGYQDLQKFYPMCKGV